MKKPSDLDSGIQTQGISSFQHGQHQGVSQHVDDRALLKQ